jgi:hypothetical protein
MRLWRDQIRSHPYPRDLAHIAQEFGPQLTDGCGAAVVHHGLLLGGLTIPKAALHAMFGIYPDGPNADGIDGDTLSARLRDLGFEPDFLEKPSGESTRRFLERLGQEMERGAFVLACIQEGMHWITLGLWQDGRIRAVDSAWNLLMYNLTPAAFDRCDWEDCVRLVRPGIWQKHYEEWLPGRDRLLRLPRHPLEASATAAQRLLVAAHALNDDRCAYEQLEFCLSEKCSMAVEVRDPRRQAIAVSTPTANEQDGLVVVVRRLAQSDPPDQPGPPERIFRVSALRGWQLR